MSAPRRKRRRQDTPDPIDVHVGARVRLRRTLLGMSQEKLGEAIGLTFQQVQKYERGANRIGASRLWHVSRVLDVPVSFFFDDMGDAAAARPSSTEAPPRYPSPPRNAGAGARLFAAPGRYPAPAPRADAVHPRRARAGGGVAPP
jgi:transcriptional regulator with XRE-family HTH domain